MTDIPIEKYTGCLIGGAIGDALGAPIEFDKLNTIRSTYGAEGLTDYVEFANHKGEFTDDTQMTLFTAEALLGAFDRALPEETGSALNNYAHHSYLRWLQTQETDVDPQNIKAGIDDVQKGWLIHQKALNKKRAPGITCLSALRKGVAGTIEHPINDSKGCGTIMRVAPIGLFYNNDREQAFKVACEWSAITHGHPTGYLSAGFFASLISDLARGTDLRKSIDNTCRILKKWDHHSETLNAVNAATDLFETTKTDPQKTGPETIEKLGEGWIAEEALSMALFASLCHKNDFKKGVLFSVNHGGDSDSTGALTGNILGLIDGINTIPSKWIKNLLGHEIVSQIAGDLHLATKGDAFHPDAEWLKKYPGC